MWKTTLRGKDKLVESWRDFGKDIRHSGESRNPVLLEIVICLGF